MKLSIIIPVYNEEKVIGSCLESLWRQTLKNFEVIVVDDGSTDATASEIQNPKFKIQNLVFLKQNHKGPGAARNLGAAKAKGEILVFVDADMEFSPNFIEKLIAPIDGKKIIGTFSKDEHLLNKNNVYARCWNLNLGKSTEKMEPSDYTDSGKSIWSQVKKIYKTIEGGTKESREVDRGHVFRAIMKEKFVSVNGFDTQIGYTDDWSLARKLNTLAVVAPGAIYYHRNPETLSEIWTQARWFGKNEFLTRNLIRRFYNLLRYFPVLALAKGIVGVLKFKVPEFLYFKITFDTAVFVSVLLSFFKEKKSK